MLRNYFGFYNVCDQPNLIFVDINIRSGSLQRSRDGADRLVQRKLNQEIVKYTVRLNNLSINRNKKIIRKSREKIHITR